MKISLLLLAIFCTIVSNAQITTGALFLGGDIQISGSSTTAEGQNQVNAKSSSFTFSPVLGWAIKDNIIVGGRLLGSYFKSSRESMSTDTKGYGVGGGVFARRYLPLGQSFYLFGEANFNAQYNYTDQQFVQQPNHYMRQKGVLVSAAVYPGIAYHVKKSFFLEASLNSLLSLNYSHMNQEYYGGLNVAKSNNNSYGMSSSIGNGNPLQIGARWIIPKK